MDQDGGGSRSLSDGSCSGYYSLLTSRSENKGENARKKEADQRRRRDIFNGVNSTDFYTERIHV